MALTGKREAVIVALKSALEGIGDAYNYRVSRVIRASHFDAQALDSSLDYVILIRPGDERDTEQATEARTVVMDMYLVLLKRYEAPTENPFEEADPGRDKIANLLVRDVKLCLLGGSNQTLGGLVHNLTHDGEPMVADYDIYEDKWVVVELRLPIHYTYLRSAP